MNKVYLLHPQGGNISLEINQDVIYVSICRNDISMVIADQNHVDILLTKMCGCGDCGSKKACLRIATLSEIENWSKDE